MIRVHVDFPEGFFVSPVEAGKFMDMMRESAVRAMQCAGETNQVGRSISLDPRRHVGLTMRSYSMAYSSPTAVLEVAVTALALPDRMSNIGLRIGGMSSGIRDFLLDRAYQPPSHLDCVSVDFFGLAEGCRSTA